MDTTALLAALKVDLGIRSDAFDERLNARILAAQQRIGEGMPQMLKSTLYNRLFGEKARTV